MLNRLIIFLIRRKLGVKKDQTFRFTNQKTDDIYYFDDTSLIKTVFNDEELSIRWEKSGVSLNWLLDKDCEIECLSH